MRRFFGVLPLLAVTVLFPVAAHAQATIAGTVRDASGAVLPGVTVEAASPALIEKARTVVTDGTGQYRVVDLVPGAYSVTFSLQGFSTVRREGIEVSGAGVFSVNVEMRVGALTETITVTGEAPVIDVQSVRNETVLQSDVLAALPASRGFSQLLNAVPSVQGGNLDSQVTAIGTGGTFFNSFGSRPNEGRINMDGLSIGGGYNGGGVGFVPDPSTFEEMQVTVSGGLGESEVGSAMINFVPKTGGNNFSGQAFYSTSGDWAQGTNLDDRLRSYGITQSGLVDRWDISGSLGGPIVRNRLWFFGSARDNGTASIVPGRFANANAGDATKWNYVANTGVEIRSVGSVRDYLGRVTAQVTPRNKVTFSYDQQFECSGSGYLESGDSCRPRGIGLDRQRKCGRRAREPDDLRRQPAEQSAAGDVVVAGDQPTACSRRVSRVSSASGAGPNRPARSPNLIPVTEQVSDASTGTPVPNYTYRGLDNLLENKQGNTNWRASMSCVTGAHNMKFGYQGGLAIDDQEDFSGDQQLTYTFRAGVPISFNQRIAPWQVGNRTQWYGLYAQDQWTLGRVTLQGALRFDRAWSWFPADKNGAPSASRYNAATDPLPRNQGRHRLQRHHSPHGHGLRRVRQRQDGVEGEPREIPDRGDEPVDVHQRQPGRRWSRYSRQQRLELRDQYDAQLDRRRQRQGRRLRSEQHAGEHRRRRHLWSGQPELRESVCVAQPSTPTCDRVGVSGHQTGTSASRCSSKSSPASRWTWPTIGVGSTTSSSLTTLPSDRRTTTATR